MCLAEIVITDDAGKQSRGSGYLVSTGWVLTAAHVVADAAEIGVWLGAPTELRTKEGVGVAPGQVRTIAALDLALVPVPPSVTPDGYVRPLLGALDRQSSTSIPCVAGGFPWFKLREAPGQAGVYVRDVHFAAAQVAAGSNLKTGTLSFAVTTAIPQRREEPDRSPWEGMSGAAVFTTSSGHLVAVVGRHHPTEGPGVLTVRPLQLPPSNEIGVLPNALHVWARQLPQLGEPLPIVTPPTARDLAAQRAQWFASRSSAKVLVGRRQELEYLAAFSSGDEKWLWLQAEAFAGKTALLAWFALHPPDTVDLVACFLRATKAENTAAFALWVLNLQLAALAGRQEYQKTAEVSGAIFDLLEDLLPTAATAARQRGRRLLLLIDGLDEYSQEDAHPLQDWLPGEQELPDGVALVVSSRTDIPVGIPQDHPLRSYLQKIGTSLIAADIRAQAQQELDAAASKPDHLSYLIGACLAACGGNITADDLAAWLTRRGNPQLPGELSRLFDRWYHRTVQSAENPETLNEDILTFSHETLQEEAARTTFARDIQTLQMDLYAWAEEYRSRGWPADTPLYLLAGYRHLLTRLHDTDRLVALALDELRHVRLRALTGTDVHGIEEILAAQALLAKTQPIDLATVGQLARRRDQFLKLYQFLPTDLPSLWVHVGDVPRGLGLARSLRGPDRIQALTGVARALAEAGPRDLADTLIPPEVSTDADLSLDLLKLTAFAAAAAGRPDQARAALGGISEPRRRFAAMSDLVQVLARAGSLPEAAALAADMATWAGELPDSADRAPALAFGALAMAYAHLPDQAVAQVRSVWAEAQRSTDLDLREAAAFICAEAAAAAGDAMLATDIAGKVFTSEQERMVQGKLFASVALRLARSGQRERAIQLAQDARTRTAHERNVTVITIIASAYAAAGDPVTAQKLARSFDDPFNAQRDQVAALIAVGTEMARSGNSKGALKLAQEVTTIAIQADREDPARLAAAGAIELAIDRCENDADRTKVACAIASLDQLDLAINTAESIADPSGRAAAFKAIAKELAHIGRHNDAIQAACSISDHDDRVAALAAVALELFAPSVQVSQQTLNALGEAALEASLGLRYSERPSQRAQGTLARILAVSAAAAMRLGDTAGSAECADLAVELAKETDLAVGLFEGTGRDDDLLRLLTLLGHPQRARQVAESAGNESELALAVVGAALATRGNIGQAQEIADAITTFDFAREEVEAALGAAYEAQQDHQRAQEIAERLQYPFTRAKLLVKLIEASAARGEWDKAQALAQLGEGDNFVSANVCFTLAVALLDSPGGIDSSLKVARSIPFNNIRAQVLTALAQATLDAGDADRAAWLLAEAWTIGDWLTPLRTAEACQPGTIQRIAPALRPGGISRSNPSG